MKKKSICGIMATIILLSGCGNTGASSEQTVQSSAAISNANSAKTSSTASAESSKPATSSKASSKVEETSSPEEVNSKSEENHNGPACNTTPQDYSVKPAEKKSEIDAFDKQVSEKTLPSEHQSRIDNMKSMGISARQLEVDGIHLYEARRADAKPKPLLIQLHGGGDRKNFDYIADIVENYDICTVSVDCAGHGESQDGPLQAPAAWMETVHDIDVLIEYYNTVPDVDATNFGLIGYSMGANISEYYAVYGKYKPAALCLENGTVDATGEGSAWDCFEKGGSGLEPVWEEDKIWEFTTATAPKNFPECFKDIPMYVCVGELDDIHNPNNVKDFIDKVVALGNDKIVFQYFEGIGHEFPSSWSENEERQFFEFLCGKAQ